MPHVSSCEFKFGRKVGISMVKGKEVNGESALQLPLLSKIVVW